MLVDHSSVARANLGIVNVSPVGLTVAVEIFTADGQPAPGGSSFTVDLLPFDMTQVNDVLHQIPDDDQEGLIIRIGVTSADGAVLAYLSAVDNITNDASYQEGFRFGFRRPGRPCRAGPRWRGPAQKVHRTEHERPSGRKSMTRGRTFTFLGPNSAFLNVNMMGSQVMADGAAIPAWSFGGGFNNDRSVPSPVIEGIEGQVVQVTLDSMMPHTIHLHGLDVDQANDGVPSTSGYVARMPGGGFGRVEGYTNLGTPFTYAFVAPHAGTYAYHCHVDTVLHFEMGMYGTVIIRPPDGSTNVAWAGGPAFDKEYVWHLHTFDSSWHSGANISGPGTVRHRPDYFMINGRDGANASSDTTTAISADAGEVVLIRTNNMGYQPALVRLGGLELQVIASDGRPLPSPIVTTQQLVAPGERYDILLQMPPATNRVATVEYLDIRMRNVLGTASTSVVGGSGADTIFSDGFESGDVSAWSGSTGE